MKKFLGRRFQTPFFQKAFAGKWARKKKISRSNILIRSAQEINLSCNSFYKGSKICMKIFNKINMQMTPHKIFKGC